MFSQPKWHLGSWAYEWNANGSLKSVKKTSGQTISFEYDALGRRTKKFVKDKTIHYIWSGNVLLHEIFDNGNEQKTATYVYEQGSFVPSAKLIDGESFSIVSDYIGRPIQVYDQNGKKVWSAEYDIYGKLINLQGDKAFIPFRQLGQYEDVETGLYYNRFRYYDPNSGLYISQDPIGLFGNNPNIYAYVFDSNTEVDVLGLIILKNPKIRNNTKIFGKGQNTGLGHAQVMENLAEQLADTGKYKEIYLNRSWNTAIHTSTGVKGNISDLRPDLILIDKNDKFYSIEVASKTDDLVSLNVRNINVLSQLGQSKNHYGHIKYGDYDALGKIKNKKGIKHLH
ncbi:hypothetical protein CGC56_01435 [Capnocytophaga canimorsus]|uniref:Teneurin-like YD-shell domain-containing protein n=1 Tax=Capnocytophaga canimorsus TaxID=28188 RepID=A0A250G0N4_9FLAO|nr:RHS repeat-associated core domain-containing protein [Capnocytophaga canimorsus]ATA90950.1 hypothetical protein CGC56_01435 [Capnocytophaga canimorsus]